MSVFPSYREDELMREMSFISVMDLYDRAIEQATGEIVEDDDGDRGPKDDDFTWNEKERRWE